MTTVADALRAAGYEVGNRVREEVVGHAREVEVAVYPRHVARGVVRGWWLTVQAGSHHLTLECADADEVQAKAHEALTTYGRAA